MGTPIFAAGNGMVEKAGFEGGYGKYIRIRHANGYETAYGHMSAFARGMEPGKRVRQGQVIGYVGSTGLSTGAHLHYEIMINGRFVDPMKIKLPRGRVLEGGLLAGFEQERDTARQHDEPAAPRPTLCGCQRRAWTVSGKAHTDPRWRTMDGGLAAVVRFLHPAERRQAAAASLPLKVRPCLPAEITTFSPSLTRAGEDHLGERVLDRLLDHALERTRAIGRILALLGEPFARRRLELDRRSCGPPAASPAASSGCRRSCVISLRLSRWNRMISSMRLRNSGRNAERTTAIT